MYNKNPDINKNDLCASFEKICAEILIENAKKAADKLGINTIALAGGVSANTYIREQFLNLGKKYNMNIFYPELKLCTDNAAMIASAGFYNYSFGNISDLTLNAVPNLKI